ncbi:MAG: TrkH family potassium uptake protein [Silicimonas sp.]|nr:TrkH family potassium uptake protein [Silicimonas sp.]NND43273.1 TrkH family potassium uptake protein [Silicimonas sp.]
MLARFADLPFVVVLIGIGALAMLVPAAHGLAVDDHATAQAFFYWGILFLALFGIVALATANYKIRRQGRSHLISMLMTFAVLPVMLAVPFAEAVPDTRFLNAYVEMVSSLTTTGLTLFETERLPASVHLWRAFVGWLGGFFVWVTAISVLAPLNLGGFEVKSSAEVGSGASVGTMQIDRVADSSERLRRFSAHLLPIYVGLTGVLWIGLLAAGDSSLVALTHAMSTLATSGISPIGGTAGASAGLPGEGFVLLFMVFALSRLTFSSDERADGWWSLARDPELRMGVLIVVALSLLLFFRHFAASFEEGLEVTPYEGLLALWGALFTVTSFLTTTGFESSQWATARAWSGLGSPGVLLLGLAVFGGGVATTAGGVKLLRVYALYKHGLREMEKLVQPSSIGGAGQAARRFRRQGAYVAWIFFMLFAMSIALVTMGLTLVSGIDFESAIILTIATLSTTGPLTEVAGDAPVNLAALNDAAKGILSAAMVLGRLETLAIIALLNPEFWR